MAPAPVPASTTLHPAPKPVCAKTWPMSFLSSIEQRLSIISIKSLIVGFMILNVWSK